MLVHAEGDYSVCQDEISCGLDCLGNFGADQLADEGVKRDDAEADKWRSEDEGERSCRSSFFPQKSTFSKVNIFKSQHFQKSTFGSGGYVTKIFGLFQKR